MHAILATMGTSGDVLPFVALGSALREQGHRVTLCGPEPFAPLAKRQRLAFEPLISDAQQIELIGHPDFWRPFKGPVFAARWGVRQLEPHYRILERLAGDDRQSVLVTNPGILAARLVQEKLNRPLATMLLQPWMIKSSSRPPIMPTGLSLPPWAPRPAKSLYWRAVDVFGDWLMAPPLNQFRASLDLPPVKRILQWLMSPRLILGMFPPFFGEPQSDWPPQVRLAGFPLYDDASADGAFPLELERFLDAADAPIAITFGTGVMHEPALYRDALAACRASGRRAVLVTTYADQLPSPLPTSAIHVPFAPFRRLFPRCAAVIHHGGIGTIAEALAAGVPQLVLPISWDQFDNAIRVKELGAGDWLGPRWRTLGRIARGLAGIVGTAPPPCKLGAAAGQDAIRAAVRHVESLLPAREAATGTPPPCRQSEVPPGTDRSNETPA
jgi:UDP:flavonoid glycosyltransferase YjiC (YdhE family)